MELNSYLQNSGENTLSKSLRTLRPMFLKKNSHPIENSTTSSKIGLQTSDWTTHKTLPYPPPAP